MKPPELHGIAEERLEAAAVWLVRLREEPTNAALVAEWLRWCESHPDNPSAFGAIEEIWTLSGEAGMDRLPGAAELPTSPGKVDATTRRNFRWAYAAGLAAALVLAVVAWRGDYLDIGRTQATEYATAQAIEREVHLPDGSILKLGGASAVRVAYSTRHRDLELLRGEAYFKVQHDTSRPFVVHTRTIAVTAVGTAFNVRADEGRTVVSVSEGVVEVIPRSTQTGSDRGLSSLRASAGQQVSLEAETNTLAVRLSDAPMTSDWQQGMLSFVDEPLRTVIVRINRYSRHDIVLGDAAVGELRFTGTVLRDGIDDWVRGLERVFPVHADARADGSIALLATAGPQ